MKHNERETFTERTKLLFTQIVRRWFWILPLFLSLLPYFALKWQIAQVQKRDDSISDSKWSQETSFITDKINEASSEGFWASEVARIFTAGIQRNCSDQTQLFRFIENFRKTCKLKKLPQYSISFVRFNSSCEPLFVKHVTSPVISSYFCKKLFQTIIRNFEGQSSDLSSAKWHKRLTALFGYSIYEYFFSIKMRMQSFYAIIQEQNVHVVWNIVKHNNKIIGAFILKMNAKMPTTMNATLPESEPISAIDVTLANWKSDKTFPVFLSLPTEVGGARVTRKLKYGAKISAVQEIIGDIQQEIKIIPAESSDMVGYKNIPSLATSSAIAHVNLPVYLAGETLRHRLGKWRYRVFALKPEAAYLGILFNKIPPHKMNFLQILAWLWLLCIAFGWLLFFARWAIFKKPISFGIRTTLFLWCFGLLATPIFLGIGSEYNFLNTYARNLQSDLFQKTKNNLERIDSESRKLLKQQEDACDYLVSSQQLLSNLLNVHKNKGLGSKKLIESIWQDISKQNIDLNYLGIVGHKGFYIGKSDGVALLQSNAFVPGILAKRWIDLLNEGKKPNLDFIPKVDMKFPVAKSSYGDWTDSIRVNNSTKTGTARIWLGEMINIYRRNISKDGKDWYYLGFIWDQQKSFETYLINELSKISQADGLMRISAYSGATENRVLVTSKNHAEFTESDTNSEMEFVTKSGNSNRHELIKIKGKEYLRLTFACQAMPNFIIVATVSFEHVKAKIQEEVVWNLAFLVIAIVLVVIFVLYLSGRLANPLVDISKSLMLISSGNLDVKFNDIRNDEIGLVASSLNLMTLSLKERKKLSEFVAPDVLKAVTSGDVDFKAYGNSRVAAVLVSDIRNFTTMSEAYSAEDMFLLLNNHLGKMTSIIQNYNGVIDRFIGDAIVAVFYKDDNSNYLENAVLASKEMMLEHAKINLLRKENSLFIYKIGIGVDTGTLLTSVLGDEEVRLDYSIIGSAVQRANQLEALSKLGSASRIIVSDFIKDSLNEDFHFLKIPGHENAWELDDMTVSLNVISPKKPIIQSCKIKETISEDTNSGFDESSSDVSRVQTSAAKYDITNWFYRLSLWLLPVLLMIMVIVYLHSVEAKYSLRQQKSDVLRLTDQITNISNPEAQLSILLRKKIHLLSSKNNVTESVINNFKQGISEYISKLRQYIPNISWRLYSFRDVKGHNKPRLEQQNLTTSFALSSNIFNKHKIGIHLAKICRLYFVDSIVRQSLVGVKRRKFVDIFNRNLVDYGLGVRIADTFDRFYPMHQASSSINLFWAPILKSRCQNSTNKELWKFDMFANSTDLSNLLVELRDNIQGVIQIILPKQRISFADVMPIMIETEIPKTMHAGFIGLSEQSKQYIPEFFKKEIKLLNKVKQASNGVSVFNDWFISTKYINSDKVYKFFIIKKIQNSSLGKTTYILICIASLWLLCGAFVILRGGKTKFLSSISTLLTLSIGFVLVMLPVFFLGMISIERFIFEKKIGMEANKQDEIALNLARIDKSFGMYNSWATAIINKNAMDKDLLKMVAQEGQSKNKQQYIWKQYLGKMRKKLSDVGMFTTSVTILSPDGKFAYEDLIGSEKNDKRVEMQSWLRSQVLTTSLWGKLAKNIQNKLSSSKSRHQRMLIGSEIDKLRSTIMFLIGKSVFNKYLLAPLAFSFWQSNFSDKEFIVNKVVWNNSKIQFNFNFRWDIPSLGIHFLRSLDNVPTQFNIEKLNVSAVHSQYYNWLYTSPYIHFSKVAGSSSVRRIPLFSLPDFETQLINFKGVNSETSISSFNGTGVNRKLKTVYLSKTLPVMLLNITSDIGKLYKLLDAQQVSYRNYIIIFLVLVFFLSRLVARRFVKPINRLLKATNEVSQGHFSVRLPNSWENEFGLISNSFNSMALEAEEGRLIGKFVSESVKTVARSEQDEKKALAGKQIQGVILFAGLSEFKNDLPNISSAKLFSDLNIYLKAMSRIIREHNGEIDKFIGDKILAVFHSDVEGSLVNAKMQAVKASLAMQKYMRDHVEKLPFTLGVGIVPGPLLAGIMGTELVRLEYTVIGDTVNLAARLSDLATKQSKGCVIVESGIVDTINEDKAFSYISIDKMDTKAVKGKKREVSVFKIY